MHFDLIDLTLFRHTLECGNITAGARRSHLSLPAASARIRAMEASLGTQLLARNRRGVQPTPAGQALSWAASGRLRQNTSSVASRICMGGIDVPVMEWVCP